MSVKRMQEQSSKTVGDGQLDDGEAEKPLQTIESDPHCTQGRSPDEQVEIMAERLAEANQRIVQLSTHLDDLRVEQALTRKLAAAGAADLEAAVLIAKARMNDAGPAEIDNCVAQLRREKAYLFNTPTEAIPSRKTASARDRVAHSQTSLDRAARKAAKTGNRADLQHYLKLRRNLM